MKVIMTVEFDVELNGDSERKVRESIAGIIDRAWDDGTILPDGFDAEVESYKVGFS